MRCMRVCGAALESAQLTKTTKRRSETAGTVFVRLPCQFVLSLLTPYPPPCVHLQEVPRQASAERRRPNSHPHVLRKSTEEAPPNPALRRHLLFRALSPLRILRSNRPSSFCALPFFLVSYSRRCLSQLCRRNFGRMFRRKPPKF